jgi:carboxyl-terminal processing protease
VSVNRKALNDTYPSSNEFVQRYEVTDTLFQELLQFAKSEQVDLSKTDSISDNSLIKKQLKAYMVRDLWKPSDYYKVMWTENESLLKALELLNNKNRYKDLLERQQPIL